MNLFTKVAQAFPKSDQFLFNMQTGQCHPNMNKVVICCFLTLFSWCLLLVMMVMIALWMKSPSARMPVKLGKEDLGVVVVMVVVIMV